MKSLNLTFVIVSNQEMEKAEQRSNSNPSNNYLEVEQTMVFYFKNTFSLVSWLQTQGITIDKTQLNAVRLSQELIDKLFTTLRHMTTDSCANDFPAPNNKYDDKYWRDVHDLHAICRSILAGVNFNQNTVVLQTAPTI